ncbi:MAG: hypothetical protein ABH822_01165 [Patescibacteria group bacterium]
MSSTLHKKIIWTLAVILITAVALLLLAQVSPREIFAGAEPSFVKSTDRGESAYTFVKIEDYFRELGQPVPDKYKNFYVHYGHYIDDKDNITKAILLISKKQFISQSDMQKLIDPSCEPVVPKPPEKPKEPNDDNCPGEAPTIPPFKIWTLDISKPLGYGSARWNSDLELRFRNTENWKLTKNPSSHEASHGINATTRHLFELFNEWKDKRGGSGTGVHTGFKDGDKTKAQFYWMDEPKGVISEMRDYVPDFMKSFHGNRYYDYLIKPNKDWNNLTFIFDEWGAYNFGGQTKLGLKNAGRTEDLSGSQLIINNIAHGPADFLMFGLAAAVYLKQADPSYFNSDQFKAIMKYQIETSMKVINDSLKIFGNDNHVQTILKNLRSGTDLKTVNIRKTLQEMFGCDWTKSVLGF